MSRCLDLAKNSWPACRPNPMVGALLVHEGKVISEGYTSAYGGPHAEVNAIKGVDDDLLRNSTLFVSLEPCAHHGKTPPCVDLIISKQIPKVIIGCRDPFPEVDGRGVERLKEAGVEVVLGVLEDECRLLNYRFMTFHEKKRPYIILKWAESKDGFVDRKRDDGRASQISALATSQLVHQWRAEEQAILVGGITARKDNPSLTTRMVDGPSPERFVWTSHELNLDAHLRKLGYQSLDAKSPEEVVQHLYDAGMQSVMIEGGTTVLRQFLDKGFYDEVRRIVSPIELKEGVKAPPVRGQDPDKILYSAKDRIEYYSAGACSPPKR